MGKKSLESAAFLLPATLLKRAAGSRREGQGPKACPARPEQLRAVRTSAPSWCEIRPQSQPNPQPARVRKYSRLRSSPDLNPPSIFWRSAVAGSHRVQRPPRPVPAPRTDTFLLSVILGDFCWVQPWFLSPSPSPRPIPVTPEQHRDWKVNLVQLQKEVALQKFFGLGLPFALCVVLYPSRFELLDNHRHRLPWSLSSRRSAVDLPQFFKVIQ